MTDILMAEIEVLIEFLRDELQEIGVELSDEYSEMESYLLWYLKDAAEKFAKHSAAYLIAGTDKEKLINLIALKSTYGSLLDLKWFVKSYYTISFYTTLKNKFKKRVPQLVMLLVKIGIRLLSKYVLKDSVIAELLNAN